MISFLFEKSWGYVNIGKFLVNEYKIKFLELSSFS